MYRSGLLVSTNYMRLLYLRNTHPVNIYTLVRRGAQQNINISTPLMVALMLATCNTRTVIFARYSEYTKQLCYRLSSLIIRDDYVRQRTQRYEVAITSAGVSNRKHTAESPKKSAQHVNKLATRNRPITYVITMSVVTLLTLRVSQLCKGLWYNELKWNVYVCIST